ncbi:MAG: DUF3880 domain-containing protein [Lachnospiraceae bacterium]|nr:DUF3880 domain-containing protein [Lachnospiraceae bacterium]
MHILFYRFNNIYEPDVLSSFQEIGFQVTEVFHNSTNPSGNDATTIADCIFKMKAKGTPPLFVFSINFFPAVSEVCEKLQILYVCWSVDCPVLELFYHAIRNQHNRIFLFDKIQFERFSPYNPEHIYYLPLGCNTSRLENCIQSITENDRHLYTSDISFVGSLYDEMDSINRMNNLDEHTKGYIDGLTEAQLKIYGYNFLEEAPDDKFIEQLKGAPLDPSPKDFISSIDRYTVAHFLLGMHLASVERHRTLSALSSVFHVDLYSKSDASSLPSIHMRGPAHTFNTMPKVFHLSKINLNMTIRPIQSGLSLRVYDVLGSGGFLITNYQPELEELFEIGKDLEVYNSIDELIEKCHYYLSHEEERCEIAQNGLNKVHQYHDCKQKLIQLLSIVTSSVTNI